MALQQTGSSGCTETGWELDRRPAGEGPCCSCFCSKAWLASVVLRRDQRGSRHLWPVLHAQKWKRVRKNSSEDSKYKG